MDQTNNFKLNKKWYISLSKFYDKIICSNSSSYWTSIENQNIGYIYYNKFSCTKMVITKTLTVDTILLTKEELLKEVSIELRKLKINRIEKLLNEKYKKTDIMEY